jgi:hypothetical protein
MATCEEPLLSLQAFLDEVGDKYEMLWSGKYHCTHRSSKRNTSFGEFQNCQAFDPRTFLKDHIPNLPSTSVLHYPISPIFSTAFTATTKGGMGFYFAVILPCVEILDKLYNPLEIRVECEKERKLRIDLGGDEAGESDESTDGENDNDDDVDDDKEDATEASAFIDYHFSARFKVPDGLEKHEWEPVLIFEAKKPGTIWPNEWGPETTGGNLVGNAFKMAEQGRKYMHAFGVGQVVYGDGTAMCGIHLSTKNMLMEKTPDESIHGALVFCIPEPQHQVETF